MDIHWFNQLEGCWRLRRRILDLSVMAAADTATRAIALSGHMVGTATFTRIDSVSLAYMESGELVLRDGARLKAVRRYLYRLEDDGACVIEFADGPDKGRRFLRFSDAHLAAHADTTADSANGTEGSTTGETSGDDGIMADDHLCGRDLYQVQYRFVGFETEMTSATSTSAGTSSDPACEAMHGKDIKEHKAGRRMLLQRTVVSGPRKDYAIVSRLQR